LACPHCFLTSQYGRPLDRPHIADTPAPAACEGTAGAAQRVFAGIARTRRVSSPPAPAITSSPIFPVIMLSSSLPNGHQGPRTGELENSRYSRRGAISDAVELGYDAIDSSFLISPPHQRTFRICPRWASIGHGVAFEAVMTSRFNCQGSALLCPAASAASSGNSLRPKYDQLAGGFFAVVAGF
jgi:hypothetical protein